MIQAYKHNENHVLSSVPLEQLEKGSWINAAAPTLEELVRINELTGIPVDSLQTALDREERSHVELEDDYIFVVVNTPVVLETDAYDALPLGIFITRQYFITVCLEPNTVIQKFLNNSFTSFQTYKKTRFLFQILFASLLFLPVFPAADLQADRCHRDAGQKVLAEQGALPYARAPEVSDVLQLRPACE